MKIEERIEKLKKVYLATEISEQEINKRWQDLEMLLGEQNRRDYAPIFMRSFAILSLVLLCMGGLVAFAQAAKPGEILYPVKVLSENTVKKVKQVAPIFIESKKIEKKIEEQQENKISSSSAKKEEDKKELEQKKHEDEVKGIEVERKESQSESEKKDNLEKPTIIEVHVSEAIHRDSQEKKEEIKIDSTEKPESSDVKKD